MTSKDMIRGKKMAIVAGPDRFEITVALMHGTKKSPENDTRPLLRFMLAEGRSLPTIEMDRILTTSEKERLKLDDEIKQAQNRGAYQFDVRIDTVHRPNPANDNVFILAGEAASEGYTFQFKCEYCLAPISGTFEVR